MLIARLTLLSPSVGEGNPLTSCIDYKLLTYLHTEDWPGGIGCLVHVDCARRGIDCFYITNLITQFAPVTSLKHQLDCSVITDCY